MRYFAPTTLKWSFVLGLLLQLVFSASAQQCPPIGQAVRATETFDNNFYTNLPIRFSTTYPLVDSRNIPPGHSHIDYPFYTVGCQPNTVVASWQQFAYNGDNFMMVSAYYYLQNAPDPNQSNSRYQGRAWTDTMRLQPGRQYEVRFKYRNGQGPNRTNLPNTYPFVSINGTKIPMTSEKFNAIPKALTPEATGYAPSGSGPSNWYEVAYKFRAPATAQPWHITASVPRTHTINIWPRANYNNSGDNASFFDNIEVVYVGEDGPGDTNQSVCGFGLQEISGPNPAVAYNWYKNGQLVQSSTSGLTSLRVDLTDYTTQYQISYMDAFGCETPRGTLTVQVVGNVIYSETFDGGTIGGGYMSDYSQYAPGVSTGNFSPGRYAIDNRVGNNNSTFNSGWAGTGVAGAVSPNRVMIVDAFNQIGGIPPAAWKKDFGVIEQGHTLKIKFRFRNAYYPVYPQGYNSNPQSPNHYWDPIPGCYAVLVNGLQYAELQSINAAGTPTAPPTFVTQNDWVEVTYLFVAPRTQAYTFFIGAKPSGSTLSNPPGNDCFIDDIRVTAFNYSSIPEVDPVTRCGPGSVTLSVKNPVANGVYEWRVSPSAQYTRGTSSFTFTANQSTTVSVRDVTNPLCLSPWTTGIAVNVLVASSDFDVDATAGPAPYLRNYNVRFTAVQSPTALPNTKYRWEWGDGTPLQEVTTRSVEHAFTKRGTFTVKLTVVFSVTAPALSCTSQFVSKDYLITDALCETYVPLGGSYQKNTRSGAVEFVATCGPEVALECLSEQAPVIPNVVALSRTAYTDTLVQAQADYLPGAPADNSFLQGRGRLHPYAVYGYQTGLSNTATNFNYEYGTFQARGFDWKGSARARAVAWLPEAIVDFASPNGDVLQEHDLLGIVSSAKFGYGKPPVATGAGASTLSVHALPYLQAHNAEYGSVLFESFESVYGTCPGSLYGEDRLSLDCAELTLDPLQAHTGTGSARLVDLGGNWRFTLRPLELTTHVRTAGLTLKLWVRTGAVTLATAATANKVTMLNKQGQAITGNFPLVALTRTGEWTLYEAILDLNAAAFANESTVQPRLTFSGTAGTIWLDDVRFQPRDAQMTTYVYDPATLRLLANFDDQHFPLLFQYNPEGKLIRKQIETERGIKTLQETLYHTANP